MRQLTHLADDARSVAWASPTTIAASVRPMADENAAIIAEGRSGYLYDRRFWAIAENRPNPAPIPAKIIVFDVASGRGFELPIDPPDPDKPAKAQLFVRLAGGGRAWTEPQSSQRYASPVALHVEFGGRSLECGEACSSRVTAIWARGSELIFLRSGSPENGGRTELYSWELTGRRTPRLILATDDGLSSCRMAMNRIVCGVETATHPRTLAAIDPSTGTMTALFDPNPGFSGLIRNRVQRLRWTAADGVASYGDLVLPPDYRAGERLPLIIVQYLSHGFLRGGVGDEYPVHLFAARGYAVLSVTRPESVSSGSEAADIDSAQRVNVTDWADRRRVQFSLDAGIDAVLKLGVVDPARIGITGLSDGSSTVQFALINSTRFRAASMTTCCESNGSGVAVGLAYSDSLTRRGYPAPGSENSQFWAPYSLAQNAARIRTPLLIQAADHEYRLALETYAALDAAKAPVEMYVFPDEHHVKMHPAHRLAVYERNLAWFDFWLRDRVNDDPAWASTMERWRSLKERTKP